VTLADDDAEAAATAAAVRIATATAAAFAGAGPPPPVPPKHGGINYMYGVYIGGSPLGDDSLPTKTLSYHFSSQRRHVKTIGTIESNLIKARDCTTTLKFNGKLEAVVGSATEVGKEKFLVMLKQKIEEHGQEPFIIFKVMEKLSTWSNTFTISLSSKSLLNSIDVSPPMLPPTRRLILMSSTKSRCFVRYTFLILNLQAGKNSHAGSLAHDAVSL
jgi:hypothetical protein